MGPFPRPHRRQIDSSPFIPISHSNSSPFHHQPSLIPQLQDHPENTESRMLPLRGLSGHSTAVFWAPIRVVSQRLGVGLLNTPQHPPNTLRTLPSTRPPYPPTGSRSMSPTRLLVRNRPTHVHAATQYVVLRQEDPNLFDAAPLGTTRRPQKRPGMSWISRSRLCGCDACTHVSGILS